MTGTIREDVELIVAEMSEALAPLAGTTLLVTGAGGFFLSYVLDVVAAFNDRGPRPACRVIALDNFSSGRQQRLSHLVDRDDIRLRRHDVRQPLCIDEPIDWIIHGASIASPTFYRQHPLETIDANVNGTRHILELAREKRVRSVLFLSTSEIYGDPEASAIPTSEEYPGNVSCTGPRACYDESKRLGETLCTTYYRLYGTPVKIVRPFNVYGPGQRLDDGRVIPDLMSAALRREPLVLYSDGRATRSFCYIRDAVRGLLFVLLSAANGEVFNLGNDQEISIREVAERIAAIGAGPPLPVEFRVSQDPQYLTDNPQRRCPDLAKLRALAPWRPEVSLAEGLARTVSSYTRDAYKEKAVTEPA